jgi:hypothetical protein
LPRNPIGGWMRCDAEQKDFPSIVPQTQQAIQQPNEIVGTTNRSNQRDCGETFSSLG